jgi:hypothetical protein
MNEAILAFLLQAAGTAALSLFSWASVRFGIWLKGRTKQDSISGILARLLDVIMTVVAELEQTLVPAYKARVADGKLTPQDIKELRDIAVAKVKERLGIGQWQTTLAALGLTPDGLASFIIGKIEASVFAMRQPEKAATLPAFTQSSPLLPAAPSLIPAFLKDVPK